MKTTSKIGHNENVSNANVLLSRVSTFGKTYNPSNSLLLMSNFSDLTRRGLEANAAVDVADIAKQNARSARSIEYDDVDSLADRSLNALKVSGASEPTIEQAKSMVREIHGKRATKLLTTAEHDAAKLAGNDVKQVTKHNSDVETKAINMGKYGQFLISIPEYIPNEVDITGNALTAKATNMKAKNEALMSAETNAKSAMTNRDKILYADNTGLVDVATNIKTYVKSVFGSTSAEYKQISDLKFKKIG